jgi:hypothetical protein
VSFFPTDKGFTIFVHVPITLGTPLMTVYKYHPVPIPVSSTPDTYMIFQDQRGSDVLAVNDARTEFKILSSTDLNDCQKTRDIYTCADANTVRLIKGGELDQEWCLYNLFTQQYSQAEKTCAVKLSGPQSQVEQLGPQEIWVQQKEPRQGKILCGSKNVGDITDVHTQRVTVPAACTAYTKTHKFTALPRIAAVAQTVKKPWRREITSTVKDSDLQEYHNLLTHNNLQPSVKTDLSKIRAELATEDSRHQILAQALTAIEETTSLNPKATSWIPDIIILLLIITLGLISAWLYHHRATLKTKFREDLEMAKTRVQTFHESLSLLQANDAKNQIATEEFRRDVTSKLTP